MAGQYSLLKRQYKHFHLKGVILETTSANPSFLKIDFAYQKHRAFMLETFVNATDATKLLRYLRRFGLPDRKRIQENQVLSKDLVTEATEILVTANGLLSIAARLRWHLTLMEAVRQADHDYLKLCVQANDSEFPEEHPLYKPHRKSKLLSMSPSPTASAYTDWEDGLLSSDESEKEFERHIEPKEWQGQLRQRNKRLEFTRRYIAHHINHHLSNVHPTVDFKGKTFFDLKQPIEAMYLELFNQFTGATGIIICKNPNCPKPLFAAKPKQKSKRKPRSDRRFCDRAGCQKWYHDNIGRVRSAKQTKGPKLERLK
ncbi:MAG: hypothetical protein K2Y22_04070 [Candidatus Obscuribacterales bacterium]|nr:hypothetical protein [Candidatus Obscuribacterales bacterium]